MTSRSQINAAMTVEFGSLHSLVRAQEAAMSVPARYVRCHGCDFQGVIQPRPLTLEYHLPSGETVDGHRRFAWCWTCENITQSEDLLDPAAIEGEIDALKPKSSSIGGLFVRVVDRALGGGKQERLELERLTAKLKLAKLRTAPARCLACGEPTVESLDFDRNGKSNLVHSCGARLFAVPEESDAPRFHFGHEVVALDHEGRRIGPESGGAMGLFSPGKKYQAAWNALMASYTFINLDAARQHMVLGRVRAILEGQLGRSIKDILKQNGVVVFLNFLVYGLGEEGIQPALGNEKWFWLKNPFVDCIGANEVVDAERVKLERKYGVKIDMDFPT